MVEYIFVIDMKKSKEKYEAVDIYYVHKPSMKPEDVPEHIKPIAEMEVDAFMEILQKKFPKPRYVIGRADTMGSVEDLIQHYIPMMNYEYD